MPRISAKDKEARRTQILDAAIACFAERGIAETSMRDIFEAAELSAGAVYAYFPSRDDLVVHLAQVSEERWRATFAELKATGDPAPIDLAKMLVTEMIEGLADPATLKEISGDISIWVHGIHTTSLRPTVARVLSVMADGFDDLMGTRGAGAMILAQLQGLALQAAVGVPLNLQSAKDTTHTLIDTFARVGATAS